MPYTNVDVDIVVSKIVSYKDIADKPKINGYELNGEVSLEDIGLGNTVQYIDYEYEGEQKRGIQLDNNVNIVGVTTTGDGANLVNLSKWDVADFGSPKVHMNLNTKDIVTINDSEGVMTNKNLIGFLKAGSNMSITQVEETYPGTETPYQLTKFDVDAYTKAEADAKFATIEQGAKADTAVQPESISDMLTKTEANTTYAKTSSLATVATSGSYDDLTDKPSIPEAYTLPVASTTALGGVKVDGTTITVTPEGTISATQGSSGTTNYTELTNKPQINSIELTGNKSLEDLGIQASGDYALKSELPTKVSQLQNDSNFLTNIPEEYITETKLSAKGYATETSLTNGLATKVNTDDISTVATTGSYNDLTDKPTIPEQYVLPKIVTLLRITKTGLNETITTGTQKDLLTLATLDNTADNVILTANVESSDFALTSGALKLPNYALKGYGSEYCDYSVNVRLTGTIAGDVNTAREFSLELQRADNTLIERKAVIKINDTTLESRGTVFETYTLGADDPFILNGLRLVLNNTSGQEIVLTGLSIIIKCVTF